MLPPRPFIQRVPEPQQPNLQPCSYVVNHKVGDTVPVGTTEAIAAPHNTTTYLMDQYALQEGDNDQCKKSSMSIEDFVHDEYGSFMMNTWPKFLDKRVAGVGSRRASAVLFGQRHTESKISYRFLGKSLKLSFSFHLSCVRWKRLNNPLRLDPSAMPRSTYQVVLEDNQSSGF
jgi:hypothetical protein